jgi:hypothetical protein
MDETEAADVLPADKADKKYLTARQAAFTGVGAMVGRGYSRSWPPGPPAQASTW